MCGEVNFIGDGFYDGFVVLWVGFGRTSTVQHEVALFIGYNPWEYGRMGIGTGSLASLAPLSGGGQRGDGVYSGMLCCGCTDLI